MQFFKKLFRGDDVRNPDYSGASPIENIFSILQDSALTAQGMAPRYVKESQDADRQKYLDYRDLVKNKQAQDQQNFTNTLAMNEDARKGEKFMRDTDADTLKRDQSAGAAKLYGTKHPEINEFNVSGDDAADYAKLIEQTKLRRDMNAANKNSKAESTADKTYLDTVDTVTGVKRGASSGVYGKSRMRETLASDGLRLIDMAEKGTLKASPQFEAELASQMAAMLTGGNQPAQQTIQEFITKSGKKDIAGAIQYLTANPQNSLSKEFMDQYKHQLQAQKKFWGDERRKTVKAMTTKLSGSFAAKPGLEQEWNQVLQDQFPEDYAPAQKNIVKTQTNPKTGQKRVVYDDGTTEIIQ